MSTRKVKEAKDLETGELIYLKGHAKATFMSDGRTVEDAVNGINTGGGGSAGGSNVYTLDIGEWDGTSNIENIPMTADVLENLLASDCVRIKYTTNNNASAVGDIYVYPMGENKMVLRENGILVYVFIGQDISSGYIVTVEVYDFGNGVGAELAVKEQTIPYQPVFGIGMYDENTDSWTSLTDAAEIGFDLSELIELNKKTYNRIKETGYDGAVSGMVNSPLVFQLSPIQFEPATMLVYDSDDTGFMYGFIVNVVKNDGTISRWNVIFNEDGIETYAKYGES